MKKDIFLKVAGAVRPRLNVTVEAKNKRLLLAAHYGQIRRKHEVATYEWVKSELDRTNHSIALYELWDANRLLNETELEKNGTGSNAVEDYFANGWYAGNQTRLEEEYELNQTMVNNSFDPGSGCLENFMKEDYLNVTDYASVPITLNNTSFQYVFNKESMQSACRCLAGQENPADTQEYCYCYGPPTVNPDSVVDPVENRLLSFEEARARACSETMRWILLGAGTSWENHYAGVWSKAGNAQNNITALADAEFAEVLTWLSQISPVTFFEINQMSGIDETRLDEASLDTLKDDNVLTERASDGNASVVANARREDYPYKEMLVELIDNRLVNVDVPSLVTPIYLSPPVFPFNFSYMVPGALEIANERYPNDDLHADVDVDIVEWNPAVLAREQYAFMTCNLESRAEQYIGTCAKPSDLNGPLVDNEITGASEVYLTQARFQRLCEAVCYCAETGVDAEGAAITKVGCSTIAGDGYYCTCEVCERTLQFDNVIYPAPNQTAASGRRLLAHGGVALEDSMAMSARVLGGARTGGACWKTGRDAAARAAGGVCCRRTRTPSSKRCRRCP